jgi:hypothetical protein
VYNFENAGYAPVLAFLSTSLGSSELGSGLQRLQLN